MNGERIIKNIANTGRDRIVKDYAGGIVIYVDKIEALSSQAALLAHIEHQDAIAMSRGSHKSNQSPADRHYSRGVREALTGVYQVFRIELLSGMKPIEGVDTPDKLVAYLYGRISQLAAEATIAHGSSRKSNKKNHASGLAVALAAIEKWQEAEGEKQNV
jgi:hypothetical protein